MAKVIITFVFTVLSSIYTSAQKVFPAGYTGRNISEIACIERDKQTKNASLNIQTNGSWTIYTGQSVDEIDCANPLLKGSGSGTFSLPVSDSVRSYFYLITDEGSGILAERQRYKNYPVQP